MTIDQVSQLEDDAEWIRIHVGDSYPQVPEGVKSAWIKLRLPQLTEERPTLNFDKLYAKDVSVYLDGEVIYNRTRNYAFDMNEFLLPISKEESGGTIYIRLVMNGENLGLQDAVKVGEFDDLFRSFIKKDLVDVVLGAALVFIAFFMIVSVLFLRKDFIPGWNSLFLVILSIGIMILTYSTFLDTFFPQYGIVFYVLFDVASSILLPALYFFLEKVLGRGPFGLIARFKKIQFYFTCIYLTMMILSFYSEVVYNLYFSVGVLVFGLSVVVGNLLFIFCLAYECMNKNKEAIILASGISIFAGVCLLEIAWYFYSDKPYRMFYWKFSILFFLSSLIIILVRRVMFNYEQAVQYSKQIEVFNDELQRNEKIELISNLAASVAHEVRNPLQVTRGFLQLLGGESDNPKKKGYMNLAIEELDRASEIITDFLTFAKPDAAEVLKLDITEIVQQTVAIMAPLATMSGGVIRTDLEKEMYVKGNASRFKQALINMIKNSIEAFREEGEVFIHVYLDESKKRVVLKIKDNGEGIDEQDLKRLGDPYYSKKTKGTGLGLMVTYRIIESMNGDIVYSSEKGRGTEVYLSFPHFEDHLDLRE
ncbi:ATP-binding protein [Paenibacillus sp. HB172176]|uniref:ATP-binding protein n=1 Tax=Paenibacillus sp. HB172176 TaxID=2493690 RepID=UPI001438791F|nr:ATP-binding protein [Paenibacillus sp. HB172176]